MVVCLGVPTFRVFTVTLKIFSWNTGPGCSKLIMLLVNKALNFQT